MVGESGEGLLAGSGEGQVKRLLAGGGSPTTGPVKSWTLGGNG